MQRLPQTHPGPDGSYIFKSDVDEGGEGEFDDDGEEETTIRLRYPASMETRTRMMLPTIANLPNQTPRWSLMMRGILVRRSIPRGSPTRTKRKVLLPQQEE